MCSVQPLRMISDVASIRTWREANEGWAWTMLGDALYCTSGNVPSGACRSCPVVAGLLVHHARHAGKSQACRDRTCAYHVPAEWPICIQHKPCRHISSNIMSTTPTSTPGTQLVKSTIALAISSGSP